MSTLSSADFSKPGDLCRRFGHYLQIWVQRVNIKRDMVLDRETSNMRGRKSKPRQVYLYSTASYTEVGRPVRSAIQ